MYCLAILMQNRLNIHNTLFEIILNNWGIFVTVYNDNDGSGWFSVACMNCTIVNVMNSFLNWWELFQQFWLQHQTSIPELIAIPVSTCAIAGEWIIHIFLFRSYVLKLGNLDHMDSVLPLGLNLISKKRLYSIDMLKQSWYLLNDKRFQQD